MFRELRNIFEQHVAKFADEPESLHSLELAAAALLMEISRADHDVSPSEQAQIRKSLGSVFKLSHGELEDVLEAAATAVEDAVSLFDFTAVVNQRFSREQKVRLLELLWDVAVADNQIDHYEEYYVRKIADLLHLSHGDYIRAKLKASGESH